MAGLSTLAQILAARGTGRRAVAAPTGDATAQMAHESFSRGSLLEDILAMFGDDPKIGAELAASLGVGVPKVTRHVGGNIPTREQIPLSDNPIPIVDAKAPATRDVIDPMTGEPVGPGQSDIAADYNFGGESKVEKSLPDHLIEKAEDIVLDNPRVRTESDILDVIAAEEATKVPFTIGKYEIPRKIAQLEEMLDPSEGTSQLSDRAVEKIEGFLDFLYRRLDDIEKGKPSEGNFATGQSPDVFGEVNFSEGVNKSLADIPSPKRRTTPAEQVEIERIASRKNSTIEDGPPEEPMAFFDEQASGRNVEGAGSVEQNASLATVSPDDFLGEDIFQQLERVNDIIKRSTKGKKAAQLAITPSSSGIPGKTAYDDVIEEAVRHVVNANEVDRLAGQAFGKTTKVQGKTVPVTPSEFEFNEQSTIEALGPQAEEMIKRLSSAPRKTAPGKGFAPGKGGQRGKQGRELLEARKANNKLRSQLAANLNKAGRQSAGTNVNTAIDPNRPELTANVEAAELALGGARDKGQQLRLPIEGQAASPSSVQARGSGPDLKTTLAGRSKRARAEAKQHAGVSFADRQRAKDRNLQNRTIVNKPKKVSPPPVLKQEPFFAPTGAKTDVPPRELLMALQNHFRGRVSPEEVQEQFYKMIRSGMDPMDAFETLRNIDSTPTVPAEQVLLDALNEIKGP